MLRCHRVFMLILAMFIVAESPHSYIYAGEADPVYDGKRASEWIRELEEADSTPEALALAESALQCIGNPATPQVIRMLKNKNERVRAAAARILGGMQPPTVKRIPIALAETLNDPSEQVRHAAGLALCAIAGESGRDAIPALAKALEHKDSRVRKLAACALARIHSDSISGLIARLIEAVKDKNAVVREQALTAIADLGPQAEGTLPTLENILKSTDDPGRRFEVVRAIAMIDPKSKRTISLLIDVLQQKNPNPDKGTFERVFRRSFSARMLGKVGPEAKSAVTPLTQALHDSEAIVRVSAASALSRITPEKTPQMVRVLIPILKDKDAIARGEAIHALAIMRTAAKEAITPLTDLIKTEKDPIVRDMATKALADIDPTTGKHAEKKERK